MAQVEKGLGLESMRERVELSGGTLYSNQQGELGQPFEPHGHCLKFLKSAIPISSSQPKFTFRFGGKAGSMLRVLIIEDNKNFREAFYTVLQDRLPSLVLEEAGTGEEALQRIRETPPDLLFVDMRLAGKNGLDLVQKIKRDFPLIRIAMLTGYDFPEYRRQASQYGVDRYFVKNSLDWKEVGDFIQSISQGKK